MPSVQKLTNATMKECGMVVQTFSCKFPNPKKSMKRFILDFANLELFWFNQNHTNEVSVYFSRKLLQYLTTCTQILGEPYSGT